jgi:hypothetical protein
MRTRVQAYPQESSLEINTLKIFKGDKEIDDEV